MSTRHTGAFVYTGSGKKHSENADICVRACKKFACEMQYCLARNNHQQVKCEHFMHSWNDCCEATKRSETSQKEDLKSQS
mmetsp:Transcript_5064/g.10257  ORF Transcript_5064/g.10257 Transcript_5064/m.10257 type:complete len:80 (+) Transcript_5064:122-361(+)